MIGIAVIAALVTASPSIAALISTISASEFVELVASELAVQVTVDEAQKVLDFLHKSHEKRTPSI